MRGGIGHVSLPRFLLVTYTYSEGGYRACNPTQISTCNLHLIPIQMLSHRVGLGWGDSFLTSHSISCTTTVIIRDYYSKEGLARVSWTTSEVGRYRYRKPTCQEHTTPYTRIISSARHPDHCPVRLIATTRCCAVVKLGVKPN